MTPEKENLLRSQLITKGDLVDLERNLISEIKNLISQNPESKKWLRSAEVRKLLNISPSTLQTLRINGTLPFSLIGNIYYYSYKDIVKILENNPTKNPKL